jgi:hypothetical protein
MDVKTFNYLLNLSLSGLKRHAENNNKKFVFCEFYGKPRNLVEEEGDKSYLVTQEPRYQWKISGHNPYQKTQEVDQWAISGLEIGDKFTKWIDNEDMKLTVIVNSNSDEDQYGNCHGKFFAIAI